MPVKILIVDDEAYALRMMERKVRQSFPDCVVLTAPSGASGIRLARRDMPALLLLDVNMPKMNGLDVCERLTSDPATAHIFILLFTGYYDDIVHRIAGSESGAVGFLCKPFREDGTVVVSAGHDKGELRITVQDEGVGIRKENPERVLSEFFRERNGLTDETHGIGSGLCIVKRLVTLHDGRVWAESEGPDRGNRFTVALPLREPK